MRSLRSTSFITLLLAGIGVTGLASAAYAGADDGGNKAFYSQGSQPSSQPSGSDRYTATYGSLERRAQPAPTSSAKEPTPWYFNHAQGTMGN